MKKLTVTLFAMIVAIMAMGAIASTQNSNDVKKGDTNGDGKIAMDDATAIVNHILGKTPDGFVEKAADVTGDGKITILDAVVLVNKILKGETDGLNVDIDNWDNDGKDNGGVAE